MCVCVSMNDDANFWLIQIGFVLTMRKKNEWDEVLKDGSIEQSQHLIKLINIEKKWINTAFNFPIKCIPIY